MDAERHNAMDRQAFTIDEFCEQFRISRATFYNLIGSGRGPRVIKIGSRSIISVEAAADWRHRMEGTAPAGSVT
jgi:predicted DNA-binding transcriptional regulator AlpA